MADPNSSPPARPPVVLPGSSLDPAFDPQALAGLGINFNSTAPLNPAIANPAAQPLGRPAHNFAPLAPLQLFSGLGPAPLSLGGSDHAGSDAVSPKSPKGAAVREAYHICYLYSWPLVWVNGNKTKPIERLDFEAERDLLFRVLTDAQRAVKLRIEVATSQNLRTLTTMGFRALHYTGHGFPQCLAFEDGQGGMHALDADRLKDLFAAGGSARNVQFVFVSACHSEAAGNAFVGAGVKHVIAVRHDAQVADRSSQVFTQAFYFAILMGQTVQESFDIAVAAVKSAPHVSRSDETKKFLLLPNIPGAHNVTIFDDVPQGVWENQSVAPLPTNVPSMPENFLGRNIDLQQLVARCIEKRMITITGEPGIGKTALAVAAARYIWNRRIFQGVFFVDLSKIAANGADVSNLTPASAPTEPAPSLGAICAKELQLEKECRTNADFFREMRDKHYLLVLDGVDNFVDSHDARPELNFRAFLGRLLQEASRLKVLITCTGQIGGVHVVAEFVVKLKPLGALEAAQLFHGKAPRPMPYDEFGCKDPSRALQDLSQHEVLKLLGGHPRKISTAVQYLTDKTMAELPDIIRGMQLQEETEEKERRRRVEEQGNMSPVSPHGMLTPHKQPPWDGTDHINSISPSPSFPMMPNLVHTPSQSASQSDDSVLKLNPGIGPMAAMNRTATPQPTPQQQQLYLQQLQLQQQMLSQLDINQLGGLSLGRTLTPAAPSHPPALFQQFSTPAMPVAGPSVDLQTQWMMIQQQRLLQQQLQLQEQAMAQQQGVAQVALAPQLEAQLQAAIPDEDGRSVWRKLGAVRSAIVWRELHAFVANRFIEKTGAVARPLGVADISVLRILLGLPQQPQNDQDELILLNSFAAFWKFYGVFEKCVARLKHLWVSPDPNVLLIQGILGRPRSEAILSTRRVSGTFILRFSENNPGCLVISYVDSALAFQHVIIRINEQGFTMKVEQGEKTYPTVEEALRKCKPLLLLFPDVPKAQAFSLPDADVPA